MEIRLQNNWKLKYTCELAWGEYYWTTCIGYDHYKQTKPMKSSPTEQQYWYGTTHNNAYVQGSYIILAIGFKVAYEFSV